MVQAETVTAHAESISNEVVETVADVEDVAPHELSPPLYEVIEPDALDKLFGGTPTTGRMAGQVTFSYNGYQVTVCADGYVSVQ